MGSFHRYFNSDLITNIRLKLKAKPISLDENYDFINSNGKNAY